MLACLQLIFKAMLHIILNVKLKEKEKKKTLPKQEDQNIQQSGQI